MILELERIDEPEQIDDPDQPFADLTQSMGDVARSNRWFGGTSMAVGLVAKLLKDVPRETPMRILDIGTGSGDIPEAIGQWAKRAGRDVTVVGVDNLWPMLTMARGRTTYAIQADALSLPFHPGSFDIVLCGLMLHHLGFEHSAQLIANVDRLATRGFVLSDMIRNRATLAMVTSGLRLMRAHPFTQHDGPASVRRAFTLPEYRKMIALSGVTGVNIHTSWLFRVALVKARSV